MTSNNANNSVAAIYKSHAEAEAAAAEEAARAREIINRTNPEALEEHQLSRTSPEACVVGA